MPEVVYRSQQSEFKVNFYNDKGTPLVVSTPVRYRVRDYKKNLLASGIADQDVNDSSLWRARLTIPSTSPITPVDKYYSIAWKAVDTFGNSQIERNSFKVKDIFNDKPFDPTVVALLGDTFKVKIKLPYEPIGGSVRIANARGNVLASKVGMESWVGRPTEDGFIYSVEFTNMDYPYRSLTSMGGLATCFAYINYLDPQNGKHTEIYPIYFCSPILINLMNDMRTYLDLLRNGDIIAQLQYSEAKLLHFAYQGLQYVNSVPPNWVQVNFNTLGTPSGYPYYRWVLKAAQLELLDAMALAEGMTSFDFSGMAVQLSSNREQYLSAAADKIRSELDANLGKAKTQTAVRGGFSGNIGTINVNFGPNSNFLYSGNGRFGAFGINGGSVLWQGAGLTPLPFLF